MSDTAPPFELEVLQRLTRIEGKIDGTIERVEDVEHDLYGNGRQGLMADHTELRTMVEERTDPRKVAGVTSLLTAVLTGVAALLAREAGL